MAGTDAPACLRSSHSDDPRIGWVDASTGRRRNCSNAAQQPAHGGHDDGTVTHGRGREAAGGPTGRSRRPGDSGLARPERLRCDRHIARIHGPGRGIQPDHHSRRRGRLPGDGSILARAILTPQEVGDGWTLADPGLNFPNGVDLAKRVPECPPVADVVFAGGATHGLGKSTTYASQTSPLFTYVVLFDTPTQASAMMTAVASDAFTTCWAKFNTLAVMAMPFGITHATYAPAPPPHLTINANAVTVAHNPDMRSNNEPHPYPSRCLSLLPAPSGAVHAAVLAA